MRQGSAGEERRVCVILVGGQGRVAVPAGQAAGVWLCEVGKTWSLGRLAWRQRSVMMVLAPIPAEALLLVVVLALSHAFNLRHFASSAAVICQSAGRVVSYRCGDLTEDVGKAFVAF